MDLLIVRLYSGEEVLTRVEHLDGGVRLHKPMILIPTPDGGLNFQPFMPYSNVMIDGLDVKADYVAFTAQPDETLADHYEYNVENKPRIAVPDKKIIV